MQMIPMPEGLTRVESGAIQFGGDWPALHLRGDDAIRIALAIRDVIDHVDKNPDSGALLCFDLAVLRGLYNAIMDDVVVRGDDR